MLSFDTDQDLTQNYKFLIGAVLPRPIAVVSTKNENGTDNLAPFSFFNVFSAKPMIVGFAPIRKPNSGEKKDTLINIEREKEFVINFVTEENADLINLCSTEIPHGDSEFTFAGLDPIPSETIKAARLKQSPIHFECKLKDIVSYGDWPGAGALITGEVTKVHIDEKIYDNGRIITDAWKPLGRGAGNDWFKTDSIIEKTRLTKAQIQK
ncbi:MAG: flavin reductase family protein [Halobacteriovoraceae bacterium]|jgi:flavin reductase (DIM6/NTAB) family NADH-FMN oxidoreductase RutF|nr:flavin reductase family protein [Halobacteriovoraceae bacterium]